MNKFRNDIVSEFSYNSYLRIIELALRNKYVFMTLKEFLDNDCPKESVFLLRHDFDKKPNNCDIFFKAEKSLGVKSTTFIRVANNEYNPFSYDVYAKLKAAELDGFELGLHSNFVEFAAINAKDCFEIFKSEWIALSQFYNIFGLATHRDINYLYNSLPWVIDNFESLKDLGVYYHAYDDKILNSVIYVNEGLSPHLNWRSMSPFDAIKTGKSICFLTHNHWWYYNHPFEI